MLTRPDMQQMYEAMHQEGYFRGYSIGQYEREINELVAKHEAVTLLDYGCGKAESWVKTANVTLFDPYYPPYAQRPIGQFDGVVCTDVMEHVPEEDVDDVLKDIVQFARAFAFITICTRPAKKTLPDGRNCHVTVQSPQWWGERIAKICVGRPALDMQVIFTED